MIEINQDELVKLESDICLELEKFKTLNNFEESKFIFKNLDMVTSPYVEFFLGWSERHKKEREKLKISEFLSNFFREIDRIDLDYQKRLIFNKYR